MLNNRTALHWYATGYPVGNRLRCGALPDQFGQSLRAPGPFDRAPERFGTGMWCLRLHGEKNTRHVSLMQRVVSFIVSHGA